MLHTPFPLPEIWRTDLPWFFLAIHAPIASPERVVLRCGEKLVSIRPEDGAIEWQTLIDPDSGNGALFLAHQGRFFTEIARLPDCLATVLAVDTAGRELWRTDLPIMLALGSAVVAGDELVALSLEPGQNTHLYRLDLATGALRGQGALPWPADALTPVPGGLIARNQSASDQAPGLFRMGADGTDPAPLLQDPVRCMLGTGAHLLVVSLTRAVAAPGERMPQVRVYDPGSLALRWSAPARTEAATLDGHEVFHIAPDSQAEHGVLVARDARTGAERWRSAPLAARILSIAAGGSLLVCNHRKGQALYRRDSGALVGEMRGSYGPPAVVGTRLYICRTGAMLCASLQALR